MLNGHFYFEPLYDVFRWSNKSFAIWNIEHYQTQNYVFLQ